MHPAEEHFVASSRPRRRDEFLAGRSCARIALRKLGIEDFPLLPSEDRAPIWPPGITGSITHVDGYCAVAVARQTEIRSLGIDAEVLGRLSHESWPIVCTPAELQWLHEQPAVERDALATAIFSAKEAF